MRSFVLPLTMIVSFGAASLAMASPTTTDGVIKSMDAKTHMITLADGTVFQLAKGLEKTPLTIGEKVAVVWTLNGKINEASAVTMLK